MKTHSLAWLFSLVFLASAQTTDDAGTGTLPPSPTESIGCEPHGDHWHCDAPATTATSPSTPVTNPSDNPGPSPVESIGCSPHGDHWHCEGPAVTNAAAASSATSTHDHDHDHEHEDDDHSIIGINTQDPGPSPTESVGCVAHGDHWDCEGAVSATATDNVSAGSAAAEAGAETSAPAQQIDNGAGQIHTQFGLVAAMLIALLPAVFMQPIAFWL